MAGRIIKFDSSTHQAAQELLPWYVTNTLGADEAALVREHLRTCAQCQSDADWQRKLRAALPQANTIPDIERAFTKLSARLDVPQRRTTRFRLSTFRGLLQGSPAWARWTMAIQAAMIVGLAILVAPRTDGLAWYRGLGAPGNGAGNVVVTFKPETTEQELRQILRESGARVVDGPAVSDAYVLSVPNARQAWAISVLRSKPAVVLAEPLDGGGGH